MNKPTVTIAIPAFNEENNIAHLLRAIFVQHAENYLLREIIVMDDGSTDRTASTVNDLAGNYPKLRLVSDQRRLGKIGRLNSLYRMVSTDILITVDADLDCGSSDMIDNLVDAFRDPAVGIASGALSPHPGRAFVQKSLYRSDIIWSEVVRNYRGGDNIHNSSGGLVALRHEFFETLFIPQDALSDAKFLYLKSKQLGFSFKFVPDSVVHFREPANLHDFISQATRFMSTGDKLADYFGPAALASYRVPLQKIILSLARNFLIDPFHTLSFLALQTWIRVFKTRYTGSYKNGLWERVASTK
jgi:biofilm PGA synthesis N-glycosyltransferase PgaC